MAIIIKYKSPDQPRLKTIEKGDWIDLPSAQSYEYKAGDFVKVAFDIAMQLPFGFEAHIVPRGSTFKQFGLIQTNSMGVVDNSYCGDTDYWFVPMLAMRDGEIKAGDRVCQFRVMAKMSSQDMLLVEVDKLDNPDRGGHGSTGR